MLVNEIINLLINAAKTDEVIDLENTNYLYHGIYIPYFDNSSPIISIIEKGLLTLKDQYENGIISLEDLKVISCFKSKGLLNQLKWKINREKYILSSMRGNIIFFSPNRNLFNRVFDVSFIVKKDSSHIYLDTNSISELDSTKMLSSYDYTEYIKTGSVLPNEFVAIRINLDKLLNLKSVEVRGVSIDEVIPRIINMVNDIYDKLDETSLNIPIINSNDGRILNKNLFRNLRDEFNYVRKK